MVYHNCMGHSDYFDPFLVDHKVVTPPSFFCGLQLHLEVYLGLR